MDLLLQCVKDFVLYITNLKQRIGNPAESNKVKIKQFFITGRNQENQYSFEYSTNSIAFEGSNLHFVIIIQGIGRKSFRVVSISYGAEGSNRWSEICEFLETQCFMFSCEILSDKLNLESKIRGEKIEFQVVTNDGVSWLTMLGNDRRSE